MAPTREQRSVRVELVCLDAPVGDEPMLFGLQHKEQFVDVGTALPTGGTLFGCTLVARHAPNGGVRWSGPFAHGTAQEPFLYLSLATVAAPTTWVRRWKIMLGSVAWDDITTLADRPDACLRGTIAEWKGTRPALVEGGWIVADCETTV